MNKTIKILLYLLIINNFIFLGFLMSEYTSYAVYNVEYANVTKIIDGDTIETELGKVRMLGINTPEKNMPDYEQAKLFLQQFQGKEVELIRTGEDKGIYGRKLRYVFYQNKNLNQEILELGLAHLYVYEEDSFFSALKKAEEKARKQRLGIWEKSKDECASCIKLVELNEIDPGEYVLLENSCSFSCNLNDWTIKDDTASHLKKLDFSLNSKQKRKINYEGRIWNDAGDTFYLRDEQGKLVLFYRY